MDTEQNNLNARLSGDFDPKMSIQRASNSRLKNSKSMIIVAGRKVVWSNRIERLAIIRKGLPYETIDSIRTKAGLSIKEILYYLGVAQTTYNKKKREKSLLSRRDSETVLILSELFDFGLEVFNNEKDKFHRWMKKPNISLGGVSPDSLFDTLTGIQEVKNALNRLEYGNMA